LQQEHPDIAQHIKAEAEAREMLARTQKLLEKYQSLYGETSASVSPDLQMLRERLQVKEDEIQKLRLLDNQRDQLALYAELDKLSAAWETLDRQVKSKVFDLSALEERLTKSGIEKAKSENKYYSAMRDKEAIETERKNLSRVQEKQAKGLERLVEAERTLVERCDALEKETSILRQEADIYKTKYSQKEAEVKELKSCIEHERKRLNDLGLGVKEINKMHDSKRAELMAAEEDVARLKKEAERYVAKMKALAQNASASSTTREAQLQNEVDKCMSILKCSTCKQNMRNTVITKCMHSFCKACVDARISTRQRKCPACNLAFSQGEVQQLFFQ